MCVSLSNSLNACISLFLLPSVQVFSRKKEVEVLSCVPSMQLIS